MEIYQIDFNGHPHPSGDWANNYILLDDEAVKEIIAGTDKRWVCVKYHDGRERYIYNVDSIYERKSVPPYGELQGQLRST